MFVINLSASWVLHTVSVNECGGICNTSDDSYAWVCVPDKVKNMNVKLFNLMSGVNETRFFISASVVWV